MKLETISFGFAQESQKPDDFGTVDIEISHDREVLSIKIEGNVKVYDLYGVVKRAAEYRLS